MKYIGTSLGGCLKSLMAGEVSEDDVMFIVTRTMCPDFTTYMQVVEQYYSEGNPFPRKSNLDTLDSYELSKVKALATRLYFSGRIHQPRVFDHAGRKSGHSYHYSHPAKYGLWMEVAPTNTNDTPAVVEAYEKYKMLDALTK